MEYWVEWFGSLLLTRFQYSITIVTKISRLCKPPKQQNFFLNTFLPQSVLLRLAPTLLYHYFAET